MTTGSRYTREIKDPEQLAEARVTVNQCWLDQPERVIGQPTVVVSDNSLWLRVTPRAGELAKILSTRIAALLPSSVVAPFEPEELEPVDDQQAPTPIHERRSEQIAIPTLSGAPRSALSAWPVSTTPLLRPQQQALPGTLTPTEALLRCLDKRGSLDIGSIAILAGQTPHRVMPAS